MAREATGVEDFFVLPDITSQLSELEAETGLSAEERLAKKDALLAEYAVKSERVHTVLQLLKAYSLFRINEEYVVLDGQVKIVVPTDGPHHGRTSLERWPAPGCGG